MTRPLRPRCINRRCGEVLTDERLTAAVPLCHCCRSAASWGARMVATVVGSIQVGKGLVNLMHYLSSDPGGQAIVTMARQLALAGLHAFVVGQ